MIPRLPKFAIHRRQTLLPLLTALLLLGHALANTAHARDMTGKAGVGVQVDAQNVPRLVFRYWRTNSAIELLAAWPSRTAQWPADSKLSDLPVASRPTADGNVMQHYFYEQRQPIRIALGFLYRIGDAPRASLAIGVRPWLQIDKRNFRWRSENPGEVPLVDPPFQDKDGTAVAPQEVTFWNYGVELPLQAEAFLTDNFSLQGYVSINATLGVPVDEKTALSNPLAARADANTFTLSTAGAFSGGAGFCFYF